jgi:hypothetical protein
MSKIKEWLNLSDSQLRLRCGEISAQEIRTIRAVLQILSNSDTFMEWSDEHLCDGCSNYIKEMDSRQGKNCSICVRGNNVADFWNQRE